MKGKKIVGLVLLVFLILNMLLFFPEEVEAAGIDYIVCTDAPNGTELLTVDLPVGGKITAYASAYNFSSGYVGLAWVNWFEFMGLGTLDNSSGTSTTFTAGISGGLTTILGENTSFINDTFNVSILDPTVDYIEITDTPGGTPLSGGIVPPNYEEWGNCSAYNDTAGYLYTVSGDWYAGGDDPTLLGPTPAHGNGINVGTVLWYKFLNVSFSGHTDSVTYLVSSTIVDYIQIRSAPGGGGVDLSDPANYPNYPVGAVDTFYGAAYNSTTGYIGDVDASSTWSSTNPTIVSVTSPGSSSTITCSDTNWGTVTINLDDGWGHTNSTQVTVFMPTVDYIEITDKPGGTPLSGGIVPPNYEEWGNCSAYNTTVGYLYIVSGDWYAGGDDPTLLGPTPAHGNGINVGTVLWYKFLNVSFGGHTDSVTYLVSSSTVDYIQIRSAPGGGGIDLSDPVNYPIYPLGDVTTFYGAAYNNTSGYVGPVNVTSTWISTNSTIVSVTTPGSSSTITCSDTNWGTVTITLDDLWGHTNTTQVTVFMPTVDFIIIRDASGGGGNILDTAIYWINEIDQFYAAAYNNTVGYIGDVSVDWVSDDPTVGTVTTPGSSTTFEAQHVITDSTCTVTATYGTISNSTGLLTVLAPRVDHILLTDWAHENGSEIPDMDWNVGEPLPIFASSYNNSHHGPIYIGPIEVDWTDTPDRGDFNNITGTSSIYTGNSAGLTTIKGVNVTLNVVDDFVLNLHPPPGNVDFIILTDSPNGSALGLVTLPVGGKITAYASGYNMTSGYVGLVVVNWSDSPDLGSFDILKGTSTTFTAGLIGGSTTITGQNNSLGVSDIFTVDILSPTLDFITITDSPDGSELTTVVLYSGENVTAYASGYNDTSGYLRLIDVNWSESAGLGSFDNLTGSSTTFTAGGTSGISTITGQNDSLGLSDMFDVSINPPTLDYINITDMPNGVSLTTVVLGVHGSVTAYASGYNYSAGYIGLIEVNWSESVGLGSLDNILGTSTTFTAGDIGGSTTITGENSSKGVSDSFNVNILPPEVDYIILTDAANGITLTNVTLNVGESITIYASAYNNTCGYIGLIWVSWEEPAGLGTLDNTSGTSTTFTAGFVGGTTTIKGTNSSEGVSDSFDVNINPPTADYIQIKTQPGGGGINLCDPVNYRSYAVGGTDTYYGAMYNYTTNYFDDVPGNSTWLSSDNSIVKVTSPGTSADIDCDDQNWGTVTITLSTSGKQNTTQVTVIKPTVDYMILTDAPNGTTLSLVTLNVGESFTVYASAYNNTYGYIGLITVNWDESAGLGNLDNTSGISTTFTAGHEGGSTTITGTNSSEGVSDSFDVNINPPTADYIQIKTQPGGGGINLCDPVNYRSYAVGGTDTYYGAMYNYTTNYFDDVPGNATWGSSDNSIVTLTSPGHYTDITCDDQNWGTVIITLSASGKQNTTQVTVIKPSVDYIHIRDEPGGLGNIVTTKTYVAWEVDIFYVAAYNDTADYLGEVEAAWESDNTNAGKVTSPGLWTNFTAQKVAVDSVCRVSANYSGIVDSTSYLTVLAPRVDYIIIVDAPNGGGVWVGDITYNEDDKDVFWAAGHNNTADYVKDVEATWESDNTTVGKVSPGPDEYTNFTAGIKGGYCKITATFGTLTNQTGIIFVINVNTLPTAEAKYHNGTGFSGGNFTFSTDITLRVTGRKENIITMKLVEDGAIVKEVEVTRHSGNPDIGEISHEMSVQKVYRIVLVYNGHNGGSNPIIVTFEFLDRIYSVHLLFNSQDGENQEAILRFNDVIPLVGVVFFDAYLSSDFEGYLDDYQWDFGDGSTGSGETLVHAYDENDEYTVTLTVTDDEGGTDSSTITVPVENIDNNNQANAIPSQQGAKGFLNDSGECIVILQCPADLKIINNAGLEMGLVNGSLVRNIEGAFIAMRYSDIEVYYIPPDKSNIFEVTGTGEGIYDLNVIRVNDDRIKIYGVVNVTCTENTVDVYLFDFYKDEISISTNEEHKLYSLEFSTSTIVFWHRFNLSDMKLREGIIHTYIIKNWEALSSDKPVTLLIDENGDGTIDKIIDLETGLSGEDVDTLILKEPVSQPFPLLLFIIGCSVFAIGVGGLMTEVGKWALISMMLPLYTRLKKEELLDQPTRYKIYGYILGNPGAYFLLMRQVLELGSGQLVYHLKQLEDAKLIYSRIDGAKKRFYPANVPKPKDGPRHFSDIEEKMIGIIKDNSGIVQKKIAAKMGISRQVAGYHLTNMTRLGVINKEVEGRKTRYYLVKEPSA